MRRLFFGSSFNHIVEGSVLCFTSLPILDEIRDVLQRPKFGLSPDQSLWFMGMDGGWKARVIDETVVYNTNVPDWLKTDLISYVLGKALSAWALIRPWL